MPYFKSDAWKEVLSLEGQLRQAMSAIDGAVEDWQAKRIDADAVVSEAQRYRFRHLTRKLSKALGTINGAPDPQPLLAADAALWSLESRDVGTTPATVVRKLREALPVLERLRWMVDRYDQTEAVTVQPVNNTPKENSAPRRPRVTINERMRLILQENPEAASWSVRQWATHLECSESTVHATKQWKALQAAHCLVKVDKMEEQARKRGLDKRGCDKRRRGRNID